MDPLKIGAAIRSLRQRAGYTQRQLAGCLNVTDKAVSKWERGLSVPDVSILTRLSDLLNCDVDNLLEGDIAYLEKSWQGLLWVRGDSGISLGADVYGKPLVDILLSYFLLAGIGDIFISCSVGDRDLIKKRWGKGAALGIRIAFLPENETLPPDQANTMMVYGSPFIYGPFLTRCFQRAMSRQDGISVLTVPKQAEPGEMTVVFDNNRKITGPDRDGTKQVCVPVFFFPRRFFHRLADTQLLQEPEPESLFAEPLDNGMVEYRVRDRETLLDTACFLRYMEARMQKRIYDLAEVARNRNFLPREEPER